MSRIRRREDGAVAVVVAVASVMLFGMAALAVDLGNGYARRVDVQGQADFAALAGASKLPATGAPAATDPAVMRVAQYLNENQPESDGTSCNVTRNCVTAAQLVDGDPKNGEVTYPDKDSIQVVTPPARVNFGVAHALGFKSVDEQATATAEIRSAGSVLPFFAVQGCDYGPQTISDPAAGQVTGPTFASPNDNGAASLTSISPTQVDKSTSPGPSLTITGVGFTNATQVGFFLGDGSAPTTVSVTPTSDTQITVPAIPSAILTADQVWYVRVYVGNKWSSTNNAQPLRVGSAVLECVGAPSDGNFGSLKLLRTDSNDATNNGWLPINIAKGLQPPLTIAPDKNDATYPWTCTDGVNGAVASITTLKPDTNCVDTDTGLAANAATAGFITGGKNAGTGLTFTGRLDVPTTPGCGADSANPSARWDTGIKNMSVSGHPDFTINDDVLTCFFTNTTTSIGDISQSDYSGGPVLSQDIYKSPRFFYMPVLGTAPTSGGSNRYWVIGYRPGFVTDQPTTATQTPLVLGTGTTHNGFTISSNGVTKVGVVFFNINALPPPPDDVPTVKYIGVGPAVIRLVN